MVSQIAGNMTVCSMHDGRNVKRAAVGGELDRKELLKNICSERLSGRGWGRDSMERVSKGRLGPLAGRTFL